MIAASDIAGLRRASSDYKKTENLKAKLALLRARARITWLFAAGPQARWRDASDELYPRWYVRSEQQSQRACGPQPERARRRVSICFVAAPRRCTPTSPASRRLASAHPALAPKCQLILARALKAERRPVYLTGSNFDEILHWKLIQQYGRGKAQRAANTGHLMGKSRAQL